MDRGREYNTKQNKSVRERQIPYDFTLLEFKKQNKQREKEKDRQMKKQTVNCRKQTDGYQRGGGWWGDG